MKIVYEVGDKVVVTKTGKTHQVVWVGEIDGRPDRIQLAGMAEIMQPCHLQPTPPRVVVVCEGGVVNDWYADQPVKLKIKDFDEIKEGSDDPAGEFLKNADHFTDVTVVAPEELNQIIVKDVEQYAGRGN